MFPSGLVKTISAKLQPSIIVVSPETVATATSTTFDEKLFASRNTPES